MYYTMLYIGIYTYTYTYIHTYIHTCIHTCMHAYIHTCMHSFCFAERLRRRCVMWSCAAEQQVTRDDCAESSPTQCQAKERFVRAKQATNASAKQEVQHHPRLPQTVLSRSRRRSPSLPFRYPKENRTEL